MSGEIIPLQGGEALSALLPVSTKQIGEQPMNAVDARALHAFLGVGKVFGAWITERVESFGFLEHRDFEVFSESGNNPQGGRPAKEYLLSLDMGKELAMVERNEKGKQARLYFIECERRANDPVLPLVPKTLPEALRLAADALEAKEALEITVGEQRATISMLGPKAAFTDAIAASPSTQSIRDVAQAIGTGQNRLFDFLRDSEVLMVHPRNRPYQEFVDRGYFEVIPQKPWQDSDGVEHIPFKTIVTGRGFVWIQKKWADAHEVRNVG